jgi:hypothetical protein
MEKRITAALIVITILVIISIVCCSCAKVLSGTGQILDGFGDGISYAGQHLQESVKE